MNQTTAGKGARAAPRSREAEIEGPIDLPWGYLASAWATALGEGWAFVGNWARDCAEAVQEVQACSSPLDLAATQQKWLLDRSCAWVDVMAQIAGGGFLAPELMAARLSAFHLPE